MTWVVIWDSNRFTLCFSDNMVFMGYQLPEGRKPGRWIFCSPSMNLMIKSLWFVNFKTLKLQPERPGSCTKQEKQFHGNLQPVWYNEKNLHYGIMTIMGNSTASASLVNEWDLIICLYNGIHTYILWFHCGVSINIRWFAVPKPRPSTWPPGLTPVGSQAVKACHDNHNGKLFLMLCSYKIACVKAFLYFEIISIVKIWILVNLVLRLNQG